MVEQEQGGPYVRDEERHDRYTQQREGEPVVGRVMRAGQGHHEAIEEYEVADLIVEADVFAHWRFACLEREWQQDEVPGEGGNGAHPQHAIDDDPHAGQPTVTRVEKEEGGDEEGILQDEEEIGQAREGHAMWIDEHIGNRPGGAGYRVG